MESKTTILCSEFRVLGFTAECGRRYEGGGRRYSLEEFGSCSESSESNEFSESSALQVRVVEFRVVCNSGNSSSSSSSMERDIVVTSASNIDIGLRV